MKVTICSCARCTANGNEYLYDAVNFVMRDLMYAYQVEDLGDLPEVKVTYKNIMSEVENPEKSSPVAKIDDKVYIKAKPEVLMEHIFNEFKPKES